MRQLIYLAIVEAKLKEEIPNEHLEKLQNFSKRSTFLNLAHEKELLEILKALNEGIRAIPYKGISLSKVIFNSSNLREFSDIDLLINRNDLEKIGQILIQRGYEKEFQVPEFYWPTYKKYNCEYNYDFYNDDRRIFHVEPHWTLGKRLYQLHFDQDNFADFITPIEIGNEKVEGFNLEGLFITTCIHHIAKEEWFRLKHVVDLAGILNKFNSQLSWDLILKKGQELDIENIILLGIAIPHEVFGINLPTNILSKIESSKILKLQKRYTESLISVITANRSWAAFFDNMLFHIQLRKNWLTKFKIIYYHLLQVIKPNIGDFDEETKNQWQYFLLYFKKPFRLWKTYFKT